MLQKPMLYIPWATVASISPFFTLSSTVVSTSKASTRRSLPDSATAVGPAVPAIPSTQNRPTRSSLACRAADMLSVAAVVSPASLTFTISMPGAFSAHHASKP